MYTRLLKVPDRSFFLLGPRGTGKTTWLKTHLTKATWFDLLVSKQLLDLMRNPDTFLQTVAAQPKGSWIVVDEVQKLPSLLDSVHHLMNEFGSKYRFALTGSSARKLKRTGVNLLAGRAVNRQFFPLTAEEMNFDFEVRDLLRYGCLPGVVRDRTAADKIDFLEAYAANYLKEEIQQEALVKNLESFVRFLEVATLANGQVTNVAGIARDAAVQRPTVQGYFEILTDTLIGTWLPAFRARAKVKEVAHPKFYFFDTGAVRAVAGRLREPLDGLEVGGLFETLTFHELRAYQNRTAIGGDFSYWRTPSGSEVDFIWKQGKTLVAMEVKATEKWKSEYGKSLKELSASLGIKACFGVYLGKEKLKDGPLTIFPYAQFLKELSRGNILG